MLHTRVVRAPLDAQRARRDTGRLEERCPRAGQSTAGQAVLMFPSPRSRYLRRLW